MSIGAGHTTGESYRADRWPVVVQWLTVERAAYLGITLVALVVRLLLLNVVPLSPDEAVQALPALAAAKGQAFDLVGTSPLLFGLQRLSFAWFEATDAAARWWPALLGGLMVLLYYALRAPLGRGGALMAASLWAISPLAVFTSRLGLGYGLVPPLALAVVAGMAWASRSGENVRRSRPLILSAIALGLLLAAGSGAYTVALVGLAAALIWRRSLPAFWEQAKPHGRSVLLAGLLALGLGATCLFTASTGLAAAADLLGGWLRNLRPGGGGYSPAAILMRLLLSEPLLVLLALAGLIMGLRGAAQRRFALFAGVAAGLVLFVSLIGTGRHPADLGVVVLFLTMLAGPALAWILKVAWSWRDDVDAWLLVGLSLVLLMSAAIALSSSPNPANTPDWRQLYASVGIVTVVLCVLLWLAYGVWSNWRTVGLALPVVFLVLGAFWAVGQLTGINYDRGAWRQPGVLNETGAADWVDLQKELRDLAALDGKGAREAAIDLVLPPDVDDPLIPTLRWALRSFPNVREARSLPAEPAPIVITMAEEQPALGERYGGMEVPLLQQWNTQDLGDFYARLRWILYREAKTLPVKRGVLLWVRRAEQASQSPTLRME